MIKVGIDILGCKGWGRRVCAYVGGGEGVMWVHMWGGGQEKGPWSVAFCFCILFLKNCQAGQFSKFIFVICQFKEARNSFFGLGVYLLKSKFHIEDKLRFP